MSGAALLLGLGGAGLTALSLGIFHPQVALFGPERVRGPADKPKLALTFDDGPHPRFSPRIGAILADRGHRATFFCVGEQVSLHRSVVRELVAQGHSVQNHTFRHGTGLDLFLRGRLEEDLRRCQAVITEATGVAPRWYRPAVGIRNPTVHAAARSVGLEVVTWSQTPRDGSWPLTPERANALAGRLGMGDIVTLHDGALSGRERLREHTLEQLPRILDALDAKALSSVTLCELLPLTEGEPTARLFNP